MKNVELEWEPVGSLYDIYWDEGEQLYYQRGPLLYFAYLTAIAEFRKLILAEPLLKWRDDLQGKKVTGDEKRFMQLDAQLRTKTPADGAPFLLYVGKVGFEKETNLGVRLFESHDPATNFCTYLLRAPPEWIMVAIAGCTEQVSDEVDLAFVEACEIVNTPCRSTCP